MIRSAELLREKSRFRCGAAPVAGERDQCLDCWKRQRREPIEKTSQPVSIGTGESPLEVLLAVPAILRKLPLLIVANIALLLGRALARLDRRRRLALGELQEWVHRRPPFSGHFHPLFCVFSG